MGEAVLLSNKKIKQLKDVLYEGQVIRCFKPYPETDSRVGRRECTARIMHKFENIVQLEDLDPRTKTKKIFTLAYKDLVGGGVFNG